MSKIKKYWKGLAELNNDPLVDHLSQNEFVEDIPVDKFLSDEDVSSSDTSRRDFLKFLGFSTAAATLASCEAPINKVIPYVVKPDEIVPGVANYYASTIYDGHDYASVLVKTREGRPIKLRANNTCTNARVQASVLSLYDTNRLKNPLIGLKESRWDEIDLEIIKKLKDISLKGGNIAILSSTIISPTIERLIEEFSEYYGNVRFVQMDSISSHGALEANLETFGIRSLPTYHFDKAEVIVSFGADFIGNWGHPNYEKDYTKTRIPENGKMSRHYQIETNLTLTGSNADYRIQIKPSEQIYLLHNLYNSLHGEDPDPRIKKIVKDLNKSKFSIVVCDSNNKEVQILVNAINNKLKNYNSTIDISRPCYLNKGNDNDVQDLINDMNDGRIDALITYNVNPSYTLENPEIFNDGLKKVPLRISTSSSIDETYMNKELNKMDYLCPDHHNLESWGDANPVHSEYSLMQPTINPLFNTRQFQDSLIKWMEKDISYYDYLKSYHSTNWEQKLHDGFFSLDEEPLKVSDFPNYPRKSQLDLEKLKNSKLNGIEFEISQKISMGDGTQANNPWLQELPDPLSRACWDNYLTISSKTASENGISNWNVSNGALNGSVVNLTLGNRTIKNVPVMIQPGQTYNTVSMAVGYGRTHAGKCGNVGINAFPFSNGGVVKIEVINDKFHEFAAIQLQHTMMGRDLVKESKLSDFIKDPTSGNHKHEYYTHEGFQPSHKVTLWDNHDHETGHFWNQSIDLNLCTGCAACVISCHAENNVPVVGREEMRKSRDMHWLRIDRYFSSDMSKDVAKEKKVGIIDMYSEMEDPSENPEVVFQPVMCMHCNHAPCENVCPVAATTHGSEGQNHMAYNRCVGTRYCANNCPYKVRRFNWFQYSDNEKFDFNMNDDYGKMVLNPDVVVRSRGVIEKCSMCIQTIQEIKLKAKNSGRKVLDEDIQTACSDACSTNAIVFGDSNDESHQIHNLKKNPRKYDLLEHLNVQPSVFYQTKIRNQD